MTEKQRTLLEILERNGVLEVPPGWGRHARDVRCRGGLPYKITRGGYGDDVIIVTNSQKLRDLLDGKVEAVVPAADRVLGVVKNYPDKSTGELAGILLRDDSTVLGHLKDLEARGLVTRKKDGRRTLWHAK